MQKISETISQVLNPETSTQEPAKTMANRSKSSLEGESVLHEYRDAQRAEGVQKPEDVQSNIIQFDKCLEFLEKAGKEYISPKFQIWKEDHLIIFKLLVYFYQDKPNAEKHGIDLHKGILLSGPVGCGKTSLMTLLRFMLAPKEQYIIKSARDITLEFIQDGYPVINKYSKAAFQQTSGELTPKAYCFDDLGVESNIKYYGNPTNVMAEILLSRHDMFISRHMLTHTTTNLSASEIESCYGNRVRSRLREIMNVIAFDKGSKDKRV
ncbi:ATPase [Marinoscillum luteum]|uniref:ATPase n=1 Tax=Marinoscillum luteum TaxID=861051 RepID=A0ABW7N6W2_9BACT